MTSILKEEEKMHEFNEFISHIETQDKQIVTQPQVMFHPIRILIMKSLYRHMEIDFRDLQNELDLTAGNLASHLRALKKANYVKENKEIVGNRPRTTLRITPVGREVFHNFAQSMKSVLENE